MQKLSFLKESFVLRTQLFLFCLVKAISYRTLKKWGKCWSKKYTMSRGKKLNKKELRRMRKSAPVDIDKHCSQPDMSLCKNCVLKFCTHSHTLAHTRTHSHTLAHTFYCASYSLGSFQSKVPTCRYTFRLVIQFTSF